MQKAHVTLNRFWDIALQTQNPKYMQNLIIPALAWNNRVRSVLAYAEAGKNLITIGTYSYRINPDIYHSDIIGHELAHILDYHLYGEHYHHHNKNWAKIMRDFGLTPNRCYDVH